jgi:molybdopterin molybdotransferase
MEGFSKHGNRTARIRVSPASTIRGVHTVREAYAILDGAVSPADAEMVPLAEALGRILARGVVSDVEWPPFDTSAMDGYAVRAGEAPGEPGRRERPGLVAAGDPVPPPLLPGEAVRLMTGAPLPAGTDAVVPVEESRREAGRVRFDREPRSGAHLRRRGESVAGGTALLAEGQRLDPAGVALAALAGADPLSVRRRPRIAIATTGNELVLAREKPPEGHLRDSNGPMLAALCRARGWPAVLSAPVPDEAAAVDRLFAAGSDEFDVLVTSGGVSAGDLDLLPPAAERAGWEILFHRVSIRPGKPVAFARRGRSFWFGLPGNPVSASACFHLFVRRALDRFEGAREPGAPQVRARLTRELPPAGPRETYRDALLSDDEGERRVEPLRSAGSHDLLSHARANALIRVPAEGGPLPPGSIVTCVLLER